MVMRPQLAKNDNQDDSTDSNNGVPLYTNTTGSAQNQNRRDAIKRRMAKNSQNTQASADIVNQRKQGY